MIKHSNGQLYTDKSRNSAICNAKNDGKKTMILDDGFQSLYIKRDLDIVMINSFINNVLTRESIRNISRSDLVVLKQTTQNSNEHKIK